MLQLWHRMILAGNDLQRFALYVCVPFISTSFTIVLLNGEKSFSLPEHISQTWCHVVWRLCGNKTWCTVHLYASRYNFIHISNSQRRQKPLSHGTHTSHQIEENNWEWFSSEGAEGSDYLLVHMNKTLIYIYTVSTFAFQTFIMPHLI